MITTVMTLLRLSCESELDLLFVSERRCSDVPRGAASLPTVYHKWG